MNEVIITGVLSLAGTLIGTLGGIIAANKLTNYRLEQLEKKVDKHNSLIERTYRLERRVGLIDARLKAADGTMHGIGGAIPYEGASGRRANEARRSGV